MANRFFRMRQRMVLFSQELVASKMIVYTLYQVFNYFCCYRIIINNIFSACRLIACVRTNKWLMHLKGSASLLQMKIVKIFVVEIAEADAEERKVILQKYFEEL